jgi:hypothetical protein
MWIYYARTAKYSLDHSEENRPTIAHYFQADEEDIWDEESQYVQINIPLISLRNSNTSNKFKWNL